MTSTLITPDAPPAFPHGVTLTLDGVECHPGTYDTAWTDYTAYRAGTRPVARLTRYPDGRMSATRHPAARGVLDAKAWRGIVATLGGSERDMETGVMLAPNPVEVPA